MHANNEVGTLQPIRDLAALARERGILLHTDAAQSVGKVPVHVDDLGADLLSIAGHKLYAPKGVGALYVRTGTRLEPWLHGASHEGGRRAGTESVLLAVGLGAACAVVERQPDPAGGAAWVSSAAPADPLSPPSFRGRSPIGPEEIRRLRDELEERLCERLGERVVLNGHPTERLPNTANLSFLGAVAEELLASLDGVAASAGSACHAGSTELSPVLRAMGIEPEVGRGAVRFSLGRWTTAAEVASVVDRIVRRFS
jgi:cysteine desulfurase